MLYPEFLLPKLPSAALMRKWDQAAMEFGLPDNMLMENASRSACALLKQLRGPVFGKKFLVFMGGGNNGGDAVCMARQMADEGAQVLVAHTRDLADLRGAARYHTELAIKDGLDFFKLIPGQFNQLSIYMRDKAFLPEQALDGLIGVALHGNLAPEIAALIEDINYFIQCRHIFMLSIDVPSGLSANDGLPMPVAIKADLTACMAFAKPGLVLPEATHYAGKVYICDIGMPRILASARTPELCLADGRLLLQKENMPAKSYKNIYGHVAVIGGQNGTSGAAHLSSLAALRMGAGLVSACAPPASLAQVKGNDAEIMTMALGENELWPASLPLELLALLANCQTLLVGPGMGRGDDAANFLHLLLNMQDRPATVLDADALFHLAQNPALQKLLRPEDVITPHPGEAAALLSCPVPELEKNRYESCLRLMAKMNAVIVLKGVNTLIGQTGNPVLLSPFDVPQMAIGGAGDVLAGAVAAMLARRNREDSSFLAAAKAVVRHLCSGMICAFKFPQRGALATDLANALANVDEFLAHADKSSLYAGLAPWPQFQ